MGTFAYVDINELAALFPSEAGRILASVGRQAAAAGCALCLQRTCLIWTIAQLSHANAHKAGADVGADVSF